ncbi:MAG: aconitase X catalytic domain-containing protein [Thermoplasmatota archaeon]
MELTKEEEKVLSGEYGEAPSFAMKILVNLGELEEADSLIPITSAHISGVSYHTAGEALIRLLEELNRMEARVSVPSSLNPAGMDLRRWREIGYPEDFARKQLRIIELFSGLGINMTCSCIPYETTNRVPEIRFGDHVSWGESNAVIYANSVIGARTNREGGISCLAASILGKTPNWGMHLDLHRMPSLKVKVEGELTPYHYDLLGAHIGKTFNSRIVVFEGIPASADHGSLKHLGAAMAAKGGHPIFHIRGLTPEQVLIERSEVEGRIGDSISIGPGDLEEAKGSLYPKSLNEPDVFVLGCPQFGVTEFNRLDSALGGRKLREGKRIIVYTTRALREMLPSGLLGRIIESGAEIYDDTCMVVTPLRKIGIERVGTDSGKAAHYIPKMSQVEADLLPLEVIVDICT